MPSSRAARARAWADRRPRALLAGRPLLSYPLAALRGAPSARSPSWPRRTTELPAVGYGVLIWREPDEPRHPLAGIVEALRRAEGRPVIVLACDLPFVTAELVRELARADAGTRRRSSRATYERGLQPLCARYEPAALDLLAGFDPAGRAITQVAGAEARCTLVVDPDLLRNVNSAERSGGRRGGAQPPMALIVRGGWRKPGSPTWCFSSLRQTASRIELLELVVATRRRAAARAGRSRCSEKRQVRSLPSAVSADPVAVARRTARTPG